MAAPVAPLAVTDPTAAPTYRDSPLSRWCRSALSDARDEVFVRLSLRVVLGMAVGMAVLFAYFHWALAVVYLAAWAWIVPSVVLMLHNTMHRPFFRRPRWLNRVHVYAMSFFFGIPTGYAEHHLGMHHVEDNMPGDLSSTMRYRRDSFPHFLVYFGRFFFGIFFELHGVSLSASAREACASCCVR